MKVIEVIAERCIGCRICEQWCTYQQQEAAVSISRIYVKRLHKEYKNVPFVCQQCEDTPCIVNCKFKALSINEKTGGIEINLLACTGCRLCIRECPYQAIFYDKEKRKVSICDLCKGNPQCVIHCPENALHYIARNERGKKQGQCQGLWSQEVFGNE